MKKIKTWHWIIIIILLIILVIAIVIWMQPEKKTTDQFGASTDTDKVNYMRTYMVTLSTDLDNKNFYKNLNAADITTMYTFQTDYVEKGKAAPSDLTDAVVAITTRG